MFENAINRANRGTSIIIEGVNIIPGLSEFKNIDKNFMWLGMKKNISI